MSHPGTERDSRQASSPSSQTDSSRFRRVFGNPIQSNQVGLGPLLGDPAQCDQAIGEYPRQQLYVALMLLLAIVLRLYRLSSQSIWVDEMLTLSSSGVTAHLNAIDIFDNLHGPLHSMIVFLWVKIAGESEFAVRFPSVVFNVLALLAIYKLVLRLTNPRTALIALTLMVISPFQVWYAQEARNYSMLLFFSVTSFHSFLDLLSEPQRKNFGKYVLLTFAALLSNMSAIFVLILEDIVFLISRRKLSLRNLVTAHLLLALLLLPWLWGMFQRIEFHRLVRTAPYAESEFLRGGTTFNALALPYTFFAFSVGYSLGPSLGALHEAARLSAFTGYASVLVPAAIGFSLAFVLGIVSLKSRRRLLLILLLWMAIPLAVISLFAIKNFKPFNARYVMVSYPAYVFLLAEGLRPRTERLRGVIVRLVLSALILVTVLVSLWNYYMVPEYGKDDFRSAARAIEAEAVKGDVIFTEGTYEPLVYYLRESKEQITFLPLFPEKIADPSKLEDYVLEKSKDAGRIWLVTSRVWNLDPARRVPALFSRLFVTEREFHFVGVDLLLLRKR